MKGSEGETTSVVAVLVPELVQLLTAAVFLLGRLGRRPMKLLLGDVELLFLRLWWCSLVGLSCGVGRNQKRAWRAAVSDRQLPGSGRQLSGSGRPVE